MGTQVVGHEVQRMFGSIAHAYDRTNAVLSGGMHWYWRHRLLSQVPVLAQGAALDVCTGTGSLLPGLARKIGRVVGIDFCLPMLEQGKRTLPRQLGQAMVQADALRLPFPSSCFDVITVAYGVRNLESLNQGLTEMKRVLRSGGKLLVLEFGQPKNRLLSALYQYYSNHILPRIGGAITGNPSAYRYLPSTAAAFPCGEEFCAMLSKTGFVRPSASGLTGGIAYMYEAYRE